MITGALTRPDDRWGLYTDYYVLTVYYSLLTMYLVCASSLMDDMPRLSRVEFSEFSDSLRVRSSTLSVSPSLVVACQSEQASGPGPVTLAKPCLPTMMKALFALFTVGTCRGEEEDVLSVTQRADCVERREDCMYCCARTTDIICISTALLHHDTVSCVQESSCQKCRRSRLAKGLHSSFSLFACR